MHGHGAVAQIAHLTGETGLVIADVHMVGHGARGEEGGGISREELVFGVGGGAAEHRGVGVALDGVFRQAVEKGHGVPVGLHPGQDAQVGERLVHDDNQVHRTGLPVRGGALRRLIRGVLLRQRRHRLGRVALGRRDPAVAHTQGEVQGQAVSAGGPHGGGNPRVGDGVGTEKHP